jgi:hypothetical protein
MSLSQAKMKEIRSFYLEDNGIHATAARFKMSTHAIRPIIEDILRPRGRVISGAKRKKHKTTAAKMLRALTTATGLEVGAAKVVRDKPREKRALIEADELFMVVTETEEFFFSTQEDALLKVMQIERPARVWKQLRLHRVINVIEG